jgi:type IV pilus assembly protein PilV
MTRGSNFNQNGFTLIEVLITMVLFSVALLGAAGLVVGIMQGNAHGINLTTATTLAQDQMEEIRRLGYSSTPISDTTNSEPYNSISGYSLFRRVTHTDVDNPAPNMKTITVTVYWDSNSKSVALQTILEK